MLYVVSVSLGKMVWAGRWPTLKRLLDARAGWLRLYCQKPDQFAGKVVKEWDGWRLSLDTSLLYIAAGPQHSTNTTAATVVKIGLSAKPSKGRQLSRCRHQFWWWSKLGTIHQR